MFIVQNRKKAKFFVVLAEFVAIMLLTDFLLSRVQTDGIVEWVIISLGLFLVGSFLTIKYIFDEKVNSYYLSWEFEKLKWARTFFAVLLFVATMWFFVVKLQWRENMLVSSWLFGGMGLIMFVDLVFVPIAAFAKEFFFRGFLLKVAVPVFGGLGAILIQAVAATSFSLYLVGGLNVKHVVLLLIPNLFLGYVAYINKSVLVSAVFSWIYILVVDLFFVYQITQ